jgi:hypothetical protein
VAPPLNIKEGNTLSPANLLKHIASPGDAAAAGIGFSIGLPIDYFLFHMGVPPGTVSGYSAVAVWSLKKTLDAWLGTKQKRKEAVIAAELASQNFQQRREELERRSQKPLRYLEAKDSSRSLLILKKSLELWELRILEDIAFEKSLDDLIAKERRENDAGD